MPSKKLRSPLPIDLALQGGGSHGAFTWGVLDRILDEPWLQIAGISGTSAGAMNAAVLIDGWTQSGREGARAVIFKPGSLSVVACPVQRQSAEAVVANLSGGQHQKGCTKR